jgi:hypothetical protein
MLERHGILGLGLIMLACAHAGGKGTHAKDGAETEERAAAGTTAEPEAQGPEEAANELRLAGETPVRKASESPPCVVPLPGMSQPPLILESMVVTRVASPCVNATGEHGFEKGTSWTAMGFPCTGGTGRIDWQGHYHNPNIVNFVISNSCPMKPRDLKEVAALGASGIGLDPTAVPLAYYPFAVQFWELVEYPDTDTGFTVSLRSSQSLKEAWKRFKESKGIALRMYGRENAWVKDGAIMFVAEGSIIMTAQRAFKLHIDRIAVLSPEAAKDVRQRCEALTPSRNCQDLFGS